MVAVGESNHPHVGYEPSMVTRPLHRECLRRESNPHAVKALGFASSVSTVPPLRQVRRAASYTRPTQIVHSVLLMLRTLLHIKVGCRFERLLLVPHVGFEPTITTLERRVSLPQDPWGVHAECASATPHAGYTHMTGFEPALFG